MSNASYRMMLVLALAAVTAFAMGCGDDDRTGTDAGPGTVDSGGGGMDGGGGGMCTMTFGPTTGDGCLNPEDQAAVMATNLGPAMDEDLADIARRIGTDCAVAGMTGEALTNCVRDGLVMETMGSATPVSAGCGACYGVSVSCSAALCLVPCLGTDMAACDACRCGMNDGNCDCVEAFTMCSGIPSSSCDGM